MTEAQGRLVVSVVDSSKAGVIVGTPLKNEEDRVHSHTYQTNINIPSLAVAAIDCCNDQGGGAGSYHVASSLDAATSGLPFVQFTMCTINSTNNGSIPFGTIGFFDTSIKVCPPNWTPYGEANGRFVIAGFSNTSVTSNTPPLASGEDRQHTHTFSVTISTNDVSYAGTGGGDNNNVGQNGVWGGAVTSDSSSSSIPYIQLLTCQSGEFSFQAALPPGALMFREESCIPGWTQSFDSAGRLIVALPTGGVPGATFGSDSFPPNFIGNPGHVHDYSGSINMGGTGVGLASGCCADGYAGAGTYNFHGTSASSPANLPYIEVVMCEQSGSSDQKLIS